MEKNKTSISGALSLSFAALIWGIAFVAQSVGMKYVGPFTFTSIRFIIGGIVLIPCIYLIKHILKDEINNRSIEDNKQRKKIGIFGGMICGVILFIASSFQQIGIMYTSVGKAGFITTLYIIIVPFLGIFLKRKLPRKIWVGVTIAIIGMYFLCINESLSISKGDTYVFICAIGYSFHIMTIDYFSTKADGVFMSSIQFFTAGIIAAIFTFVFEKPDWISILSAWMPILYAGIMSSGIAYTLQIIGQKHVSPVIASLIMSMESVFSVLAGWIILNQKLSSREVLGCILVFLAIIWAQVPDNFLSICMQKKPQNKSLSR